MVPPDDERVDRTQEMMRDEALRFVWWWWWGDEMMRSEALRFVEGAEGGEIM